MHPTSSDSAETELLLQKVSEGDAQAFDSLFAKHRALLHAVVEMRLHPRLRKRIDPSDVVQEAHADAFRRLSEFLERRPMPFRLWLRRTTQERLIKVHQKHLGAERRSILREEALPDRSSLALARLLIAPGAPPGRRAEQKEQADLVRRALARLADTDREILLMRYVEKLDNQEIGALLDLRPDAVSKRHGRALIKLQRMLHEFGIGDALP